MEDDDSDFDDLELSGDDIGEETSSLREAAPTLRPRKNWRDIERHREQRELDGLLRRDAWFEELERI